MYTLTQSLKRSACVDFRDLTAEHLLDNVDNKAKLYTTKVVQDNQSKNKRGADWLWQELVWMMSLLDLHWYRILLNVWHV